MVDKSEKWLGIVGYKNRYQVSNLGHIRSLLPHNGEQSPLIMTFQTTQKGYCRVQLVSATGKRKTFCVHRIVAEAFCQNDDCKPQVNHIDGNKSNNMAANLEWVTNSENQLHAYKKGLHRIKIGADNAKSRPVIQLDKSLNFIAEWGSAREAAEALGICRENINSCCRGCRKSTGGFIWRLRERRNKCIQ